MKYTIALLLVAVIALASVQARPDQGQNSGQDNALVKNYMPTNTGVLDKSLNNVPIASGTNVLGDQSNGLGNSGGGSGGNGGNNNNDNNDGSDGSDGSDCDDNNDNGGQNSSQDNALFKNYMPTNTGVLDKSLNNVPIGSGTNVLGGQDNGLGNTGGGSGGNGFGNF